MFVLYLKAAMTFIENLPQIQSVILKEDLESKDMISRMNLLESLIDPCGSNFNINMIVEELSNRPPMPFREEPIKSRSKDSQLTEKEIFEHAIITCWYIYPGYSKGLHSVVEYLAEKMDSSSLEGFSPACIQVLEEVGSRKDSTAKAARIILQKIRFGDEGYESEGKEVHEYAKDFYDDFDKEDESVCCDCIIPELPNFFRSVLRIQYSEEKEDRMTFVQMQVEPDRF